MTKSCRTTPFSFSYEYTDLYHSFICLKFINWVFRAANKPFTDFSEILFCSLSVICTSLFSFLCKYYTSKNADGNFVYYITGYTPFPILILSLPPLGDCPLHVSTQKKLCTVFHITFVHWKDLEVGKKHKHTVFWDKCDIAVSIKLHFIHTFIMCRVWFS
jgi:hypothetical protein